MTSEDLLPDGSSGGSASPESSLPSVHGWAGGAERLLREQEDLFRTLADTVPQLVSIADANGATRWYNKAWYEFTGTTFDQVEGWRWQSVQHPDHARDVVERVRQCLRSGTAWEDSVPLRARDGTYHWFLTRITPVRDAHGLITSWLAIGTSIAGLTGVQPVRRATAPQAGERGAVGLFRWKHNGVVAEANDAFCRMLGITQSDVAGGWANLRLCTPREWRELDAHKELELTAKGTTTSWEKEFFAADGSRIPVVVAAAPCDAEAGCWIGVCVDMRTAPSELPGGNPAVRQMAHGMSRLVRDVVEMTRIATGTLQVQREWLDVRPFLASAASMFERDAHERGIALLFDMESSTPPRMAGDRLRLTQAVANVLDNAIRYTPHGGEVRLAVRGTGLRTTHVEIVVIDTGAGIEAADLERIRDRCRQPGMAGGGPGFGIPIATGIIEAHGGLLDIESEVGTGTRVAMTVPVTPPEDAEDGDECHLRLVPPTRMLNFPAERMRGVE